MKNTLMMSRTGLSGLIFVVALGLWARCGKAQMTNSQVFDVDFSQPSGPPLVKTKFGVYQTPLVTLPRLLNFVPLLREINVRDLRYELGWGKPESLAASQISGTGGQLSYDFSTLDAFLETLKLADVKPLLAVGYCPDPLKSRSEWAGWKDMPSDLEAWQKINRDYALHLNHIKSNAAYEVWNEPDMPEPGGKMFFSGTPEDYSRLFSHATAGIKQGDGDALVGGPAAAWNLAYLAPILAQPLDFASIHGYDNYPVQLSAMRAALAQRPDLPIFLSEYASFSDLPPNGPQSRHAGAMRFFRDAKALLNYTDVAKVYWAQWMDAGDAPGMGLLTFDGHRKAIFNAFKIYGAMPVERVAVKPDASNGINLMASTDKHHACVVLWNESSKEQRVQLNLHHLPFAKGVVQTFRIDGENASFVDNPASENLRALQTAPMPDAPSPAWNGVIPSEGVVFLDVSDGTHQPLGARNEPGTFVRSYYWFLDRKSNAYADFDARTWTARLGMGDNDFGSAQIGNLIENPSSVWRVQAEKSGPFQQRDEMLLGLRLDFPSKTGSYSRSVLFYGGRYNPRRSSVLPWGKRAAPDKSIFQNAFNTGLPFDIHLRRVAPADWNGQRVIITFLMQNTGRNSQAKFTLTKPQP